MEKKDLVFYTLKELEKILGKGRTTLYNWRKSGKLIAYAYCGKNPLFRWEEIENCLELVKAR